jgi:Uma2 family endonuclease
MITNISQLDMNGTYSYADYLTWKLMERVELIKGKIMKISPAPNVIHQSISRNFTGIFFNYFRTKNCRALAAPIDVSLYDKKKSVKQNKDVFTVVQPDLCVICDLEKLNELGCMGAPDLIIEILSPGNSKKEMRIKYDLYEEAGVREYWVADPEHQTVHIFVMDENEKYRTAGIYVCDDVMTAQIFPDLHVDLAEVFAD